MSDSIFHWQEPPRRLELPPGEVHLWRLPLEADAACEADCRRLLSADEVTRADRFRFDVHRRRFTVGRAGLRRLLACYLETPGAGLAFSYGNHGKPMLAEHAWLEFNVSNSDELALVAVSRNVELGVDLELVRPMYDARGLAERFFAETESQQIEALPADQRLTGFFLAWTRKEAYLKAVGKGLSFPLKRVIVTVQPDEESRFVEIDGDRIAAATWWLHGFTPADGYLAALAVPAAPSRVVTFHLPSNP